MQTNTNQPTPAPRAGRFARNAIGRERFRILPFTNAGGSPAFRVQGMTRDGVYIRQNFPELHSAKVRQIELNQEYLLGQAAAAALRFPRMTDLDDDHLRLAETAFKRLDSIEAPPGDLLHAVEDWLRGGRKRTMTESPRLDDAVKQFLAWLDATPALRDVTKANLRHRVRMFANASPNRRLDSIEKEHVRAYLAGRRISAVSQDNDRRVLARFFDWCKQEHNWLMFNPAKEVKIELPEKGPPVILSVADCERLLRAAEAYQGGKMVPYLAVTMFAGLRPDSEALRLDWENINFKDGEIMVKSSGTKTKRSRIVEFNGGRKETKPLCAALSSWLQAYRTDDPFFPAAGAIHFANVRRIAGFGTPTPDRPDLKPWVQDVLRHTAVSHFFRLTGSYGQTAEFFGNSETIIREHYQGRVSTSDTAAFYALRPTKGSK